MKRKNPILTLVSVVLVFFLFTPVLIKTFNISAETNLKHFSLTATSGAPTKLDAQPFEEREKEEEAVSHSLASLPLIAVLTEPSFLQQSVNFRLHPQVVSLKCEHQPRYLMIRSLLI
jgi:hypothetical protein